MNIEEKERLIKKDLVSIENRVRHAFNQGYEMGLKESRSEIPNKWIPVSERLPEKTGIYLITIGDLVTSKSFDGHNFRTESEVRFIPDAWMPLPTPFKAESEDKE